MHQPIPPISLKPQAPPERRLDQEPTRQPGVPPKVTLALLVLFVVAYAGSNLPVFHRHQAPPAPVSLGKIQIDPDGDDPREELLYHWQDPKFSQEEQHQIMWMVNGLALFAIWRVGKRVAREQKK